MRKEEVTRESLIQFLVNHKNILNNEFHILEIGIFGSYARGEQNPESDIDFIVEFDDNVENIFELKSSLKLFFKNKLHKETDIARKKYLKNRIRAQILKEAIYV